MSVSNQIAQSWLPDPELVTARAIEGDAGWGRALSATLSNFPETAPEGLALPEFLIVEQVMAQLAIALGTDTSRASRHQKALFKRLGDKPHYTNFNAISDTGWFDVWKPQSSDVFNIYCFNTTLLGLGAYTAMTVANRWRARAA